MSNALGNIWKLHECKRQRNNLRLFTQISPKSSFKNSSFSVILEILVVSISLKVFSI